MPWLTQPLTHHQNSLDAVAHIVGAGLAPFDGSPADAGTTRTVTILDTIDHLLARAGLACTYDGTECRLSLATDPQLLASFATPELPQGMIDAWPPGPMQEHLAPIIGIRAILPITEATWQQQTWHVSNENGKRIATATVSTDGKRVALGLVPLRGFDAATKTILQQCLGLGWQPRQDQPFLAAALATCPKPPAPADITEPNLGGLVTLRQVADNTLAIAIAQIPGIIADYDTEFLHDYRVCIRRVRSLLTTIKTVLAPAALAELKTALGDAARATNELRDLDVYLLDRQDLLGRLPTSLAQGGDYLFDILLKDRQAAHVKTAEFLSATSFEKNLSATQQRLHSISSDDLGPDATTPIAVIARKAIAKAYKKVIKCGRTITTETPEADVHELRILCKKLRYTIDFFGPMLHPASAKALKKRLKKLQDLLGTFNDRCVQEDKLLDILHNRLSNSVKSRAIAAAIGALVANLNAERIGTRPGIIAAFRDFSDNKVKAYIADLTSSDAGRIPPPC